MIPVSAVCINEKVFNAIAEQSNKIGAFVHGFTYGGHPVSCAVALEVLKIYEEIDIVDRVKKAEQHFMAGMARMAELPIVGQAAGVGLIGGVELEKDPASHEGFSRDCSVAAFDHLRSRDRRDVRQDRSNDHGDPQGNVNSRGMKCLIMSWY
jgi:4-aminobutyrate--pyruvate transaminase